MQDALWAWCLPLFCLSPPPLKKVHNKTLQRLLMTSGSIVSHSAHPTLLFTLTHLTWKGMNQFRTRVRIFIKHSSAQTNNQPLIWTQEFNQNQCTPHILFTATSYQREWKVNWTVLVFSCTQVLTLYPYSLTYAILSLSLLFQSKRTDFDFVSPCVARTQILDWDVCFIKFWTRARQTQW
jgi:hypothetical protein